MFFWRRIRWCMETSAITALVAQPKQGTETFLGSKWRDSGFLCEERTWCLRAFRWRLVGRPWIPCFCSSPEEAGLFSLKTVEWGRKHDKSLYFKISINLFILFSLRIDWIILTKKIKWGGKHCTYCCISINFLLFFFIVCGDQQVQIKLHRFSKCLFFYLCTTISHIYVLFF